MVRFLLLLLLVGVGCCPALADDPVPAGPKKLTASRVGQAPKIDAVLDDEAWQQVQAATDFIQRSPNPGRKDTRSTEVKIVYDDRAIYVGAILHDVAPDSILRQLSKRDNLENSDFFAIFLDTYHDKLNGYGFFVTPAGVQMDARYSPDNEDFGWNAVWESKAAIVGNTWIVEIKIPYSAIRFSKDAVQTWGLNFMRRRQQSREDSFWNPIDQKENGFLNQWGVLEGLENIKSPLRLSLTPYVSGYLQHYPYNQAGQKNATSSFNGGMDVKFGISESFTLDMTLVPDFGQVQSDNRVLNLTPFEVQFNENRQFFTEGTELFNKGNFFYSRRIGATPLLYGNAGQQLLAGEKLVRNPAETKLINATKISGRTRKNLGIGFFNAVTANAYAVAEGELGRQRRFLTQPLTNYNIVVLDQALKNNSYVSFINTNVMRNGHTYDANLTGLLFRFADKKNRYALEGKGSLSQKYGMSRGARPDLGHSYQLRAGKISGNWQYDLTHRVESGNYDINDLGILFQNNNITESATLRYSIFEPFWKLLNFNAYLGANYSRRYDPNTFQDFGLNGELWTMTKKFLAFGIFFNTQPVVTHDFYEPRELGQWYDFPANNNIGGFVSTDYRKKLAVDLNFNYRGFKENNRHRVNVAFGPRYRFNNQFSVNGEISVSEWPDDLGYAARLDKGLPHDSTIFGRRDLRTFTNTLQGNYIFTNRMSLSLRGRHYWSKVLYHQYYALQPDGGLQASPYQENHDTNFNAFNVDMVFSWWFAPGSEMSVVWKNAITPASGKMIPAYFDNLGYTLRSPQSNSLSMKILYYIDYQNLRKRSL
jgi:hypothetical protein